MSTPRPISIQESAYVGKVLMTMGARVSAVLAAFSGWMLIGFAAILGTLLANLESVSKILAPNTLSAIAKLFAVAVLLSVLQRYSSAIVAASAAGGKEVEEHPIPDGMNISVFLDQLERATLWPTRYMVRWSNRKILNGDLATGGRLISTLAQIEAWLVFTQLLVSIAAIWVLASGLRG